MPGCGFVDAVQVSDTAERCESRTRDNPQPSHTLVEQFLETNASAGSQAFSVTEKAAVVRNINALSADDARAILWGMCIIEHGGNCPDPTTRPDGTVQPPEKCFLSGPDVGFGVPNPFLAK